MLLGWIALAAFPVRAEGLPVPLLWKSDRKEYGIPDTIVAVWTYAVAHRPGQPPARGFGGRIMFFQEGRERPVKVDGTLAVYAFEETNSQEQKVMPDRRYVFTPEELASCYSQSRVGHSYSVWIPWDEAGGPQRTISLIVCFTSRAGKTIVSQQAKMTLPGPRSSDPAGTSRASESAVANKPRVWTVPMTVRGTGPASSSPAGNSAYGRPVDTSQPADRPDPTDEQPHLQLVPPQAQWLRPMAPGVAPASEGAASVPHPAAWAHNPVSFLGHPGVLRTSAEQGIPYPSAAQWASYEHPAMPPSEAPQPFGNRRVIWSHRSPQALTP